MGKDEVGEEAADTGVATESARVGPPSCEGGGPLCMWRTIPIKIEDAKRDRSVLLVYYSARSRNRLEAMLRSQGADVYSVSGRALDAAERVRRHPKDLAVVDKDVTDISVSQATRRVGQILPSTLVFAVGSDRQTVEVYKNGRQIGAIDSDEIARFASAQRPAGAKPGEPTTGAVQEPG